MSEEHNLVINKLTIIVTISVLLVMTGCQRQPWHREQKAKGQDMGEMLPEWAFDAPHYFRPPPDATPKAINESDPDYPLHYYVRSPVVLLGRPANDVPTDRAPRIAVWWTNTNGCMWSRSGYFGLGQTHYSFVAGDEGDYGIRFVGPGIRESLTQTTLPHRIYHYDVTAPEVFVTVQPDQPVYEPNETIWLHWKVCDPNIDDIPVQLALCWSWENPDILDLREGEPVKADSDASNKAESRLWKPLKPLFEAEGVLAYTIPAFAAGEGLQLQVRAKDKAGNYGAGYSKVIFVNGTTSEEAFDQGKKQAEDTNSPATQPAVEATTRPADGGNAQVSASPMPRQITPQPLRRETSATAARN